MLTFYWYLQISKVGTLQGQVFFFQVCEVCVDVDLLIGTYKFLKLKVYKVNDFSSEVCEVCGDVDNEPLLPQKNVLYI